MKMSSLSKASLLLFFFFGIDKLAAILRQLIIARQFGMSVELDVFNIANNLPDMLFILISGGAMAMVIIPVMTEIIEKKNRESSWKTFSSVINVAFLASLVLSLLIFIFAGPLVRSEIGIAPGFGPDQQQHVINLMRLNLIATIIFSISGMVMGSLQANRRFLLPALAPILYNVGQIFGAIVLAPTESYQLIGISLPAFGMGIYGLVGGVILGALLHLAIQVPGLIRLNFRWYPMIDFDDVYLVRMLKIFVPRIVTVFFIQLIFIIRDNLASRLQVGSVTALSYGYMFQQLPETLIGTALGTAILPSLSLFVTSKQMDSFRDTLRNACKLVISASFGIGVIMAVGMGPLIQAALGFADAESALLMWTLRGFLVGLAGHCLLEVANRAYYAQQDAAIPLLGTILNLLLYIGFGMLLYQSLGTPGISLTDSISFTIQALVLLFLLTVDPKDRLKILKSLRLHHFHARLEGLLPENQIRMDRFGIFKVVLRTAIGAAAAGMTAWLLIHQIELGGNNLVKSVIGMLLAGAVYLPFVIPEIKMFRHI